MEFVLLPLVLLCKFPVFLPLNARLLRQARFGQMGGRNTVILHFIQLLSLQANSHKYSFSILSISNSEIASVVVATFMGMIGGCMLFIPFYHPLHDYFKVPSEVTSISLLIFFVSIVWKYDRKSNRYAAPKPFDFWSKALMAHLIGHYLVNLGTAIFINPEDMISIGLHEKVGNCTEMTPVHTVLGTLQRRKYLCVTDYDEKYYDFHCLPDGKLPDEGSIWYTICGTPFEWVYWIARHFRHNRYEIFLISLAGIVPSMLRCFHSSLTSHSWCFDRFISTTTRIWTNYRRMREQNYSQLELNPNRSYNEPRNGMLHAIRKKSFY